MAMPLPLWQSLRLRYLQRVKILPICILNCDLPNYGKDAMLYVQYKITIAGAMYCVFTLLNYLSYPGRWFYTAYKRLK